jgi:aarF domain-containing kinase
MSGKRLLDLAALFNASRGVAQKHVALRSRQVDVYNRTSTLARAVKSQTDRVTETAKAASFLFSRLNEKAPSWTSEAAEPANVKHSDEVPIPSKDSTDPASTTKPKEGIEQNHFYERSLSNSAIDPPPKDDLSIHKEKPERYPLPDGTIPPADSQPGQRETDHDVISTRPKDESSKEPLGQDGLHPASSNAYTIPTPAMKPLSSQNAKLLQRQPENQIPSQSADAVDGSPPDPLEDGHDEDSFYRKSKHTAPSLSSLPRVKLPKHTSNFQGEGKIAEKINSDSFYQNTAKSETIPSAEAVSEQEVPEGVNTDLFYSPRVAKLLGGRTQGEHKDGLQMEGANDTPIEHGKLRAGKDQDIFNLRISLQKHPLDPSRNAAPRPLLTNETNTSEEMEELGRAIEAELPQPADKVRPLQSMTNSKLMTNSKSDR